MFILFSLGIVTVIFIKKFNKRKVLLSNIINICALILCYALLAYATIAPWNMQVYFTAHGVHLGSEENHSGFNLISLFIMLIYLGMFIYSTFIENKSETSTNSVKLPKWLNKINMKFAVIIFCSLSIGIIGISVGLSFVDESLIEMWFGSDKGSFGATLLLGIPTSIPELISIILLCKIKNYDAAYQTIIGSCLFSVFALTLCDALTTHISGWTIYDFNFSDYSMKNIWTCDEYNIVTLSLLMSLLFAMWLICCLFKKGSKIGVGICSGANVVIFLIYLLLGFLYMSFPQDNILLNTLAINNSCKQDLLHYPYCCNKSYVHQFFENLNVHKIW